LIGWLSGTFSLLKLKRWLTFSGRLEVVILNSRTRCEAFRPPHWRQTQSKRDFSQSSKSLSLIPRLDVLREPVE
jgi:hypothetical protein